MIIFLAQLISRIGISLLSSVSPHHTPATFCGAHDDIQFCDYAGDPGSHRVIYFMHGFGNDVTAWTWNPVNGRIDKQWADEGVARPTIVSLSKNVWWYTDPSQGEQLTAFVRWFEKAYLSFNPERVLYGDSMGAHNAFRWANDFPDLFTRLALTCPAVPTFWVKDGSTKPLNGVYEPLANLLISDYYKDSREPEYNLLDAVRTGPWGTIAKVHIIASTRDDFGFYPGDAALAHRLQSNPALEVTFEEQSINHCDPQQERLARFLAL